MFNTRPSRSSPPSPPVFAPAQTGTLSLVLAGKLVMTAMFWGGTFIAGKVLAQAMPLLPAAFARFVIAAGLLVVVAYRLEGGLPRLTRSQLLTTAALGFTGIFLYNVFFFRALTHIPAGRTALFVSLNPVMTSLAASALFHERLGGKRWAGIALALVGSLVVITRGDLVGVVDDFHQSFGAGELAMALAVLSWVAYTLISRRALQTLSPVAATTYAALWGLGFLFVAAAGELGSVPWSTLGWQAWASLFYLGAFGTVVAFVWYYQGIRAVGPSRTAVFTNLVPAFGVLLSALLLGEEILASMLIGGVIAAYGVSLTNRK